MEIVKFLLSDQLTFPAFQLAFLLFAIYACAKDRGIFVRKGSCSLTVKRGEESWKNFNLAYGVLAVVFLQAINATEAWRGYKTVVTIIDLSLLLYLCFFSGWCRNKILGVILSSKEMEER